MMEIRNNYRDNKDLRDRFNALAQKVHGLNFENWYQNGYWKDYYNPYSVILDDKIVANVSVNEIDFMWNQDMKHLIQIGTVMTDPEFRNRGLIRLIMQQIEQDYEGKYDGIYLFANNSVLNFYPKFGYHKEEQYEYQKQVSVKVDRTVVSVSMENKQEWDAMKAIIEESKNFYSFDMANNSELQMFYLSQFMKKNVFYVKPLNAYVVAEENDSELLIYAVYSKQKVDLEEIIHAFGTSVKSVRLGFVPENKETYECKLMNDPNTTLFVKGKVFDHFSEKRLMFPLLSYA